MWGGAWSYRRVIEPKTTDDGPAVHCENWFDETYLFPIEDTKERRKGRKRRLQETVIDYKVIRDKLLDVSLETETDKLHTVFLHGSRNKQESYCQPAGADQLLAVLHLSLCIVNLPAARRSVPERGNGRHHAATTIITFTARRQRVTPGPAGNPPHAVVLWEIWAVRGTRLVNNQRSWEKTTHQILAEASFCSVIHVYHTR
jgi:hypothetical protein